MIILGGYSKNLYGVLRKYLKLPRPPEIWRNVPDKWTFWQILLYADMILSVPLGYAQKPMSIVNTIIGLLILLEVKQVASGGIVIIAGLILFFLLLIAGHIAVVMGLIKRSAELQNSQNSDLIEIRDNVRKLLDNTRTSKNEEKVL